MDIPVLRLAVGVLTYNRLALLERTLRSLLSEPGAFSLDVYDNGSTDDTREYLTHLEVITALDGLDFNASANHTTGHGMNKVIGMAMQRKPDIVLFTADDYEYKPGWYDKLQAFWQAAPDDVVLASLNIEPAYGWNVIFEQVEYGGVRGLIRASLPGSQWSFRARDWGKIGPIREATGGEDLEICRRLTSMGHRLAALDLSVHTGERASAWGNQSWQMARPLPDSVMAWLGEK